MELPIPSLIPSGAVSHIAATSLQQAITSDITAFHFIMHLKALMYSSHFVYVQHIWETVTKNNGAVY